MTSYGVFRAISGLSEFEGVSRLLIPCPKLHNSVSIYRRRFGSLEGSEARVHMLWPFDLFLKQA